MRVQLMRGTATSRLRRDEGAVAVFVALLAVGLLVLGGFTVDFGMAYAQRQAFSSGADSAALAIARTQYDLVSASHAKSCSQLISDDAARASTDPLKASRIALERVNANAPFGRVLGADEVTASLTCAGAGVLKATVAVNTSINTGLGKLVGVQTLTLGRKSAAALGVMNNIRYWIPFAVCVGQANDIQAKAAATKHPEDLHVLISKSKVWDGVADCGSTSGSGNWGWLDCPDPTSLSDALQQSCQSLLTMDDSTSPPTYTVTGKPGSKGGSVTSDMATLLDKAVTMPVYSTAEWDGTKSTFTVVGVMTVKLCGYSPKNTSKAVTGACYVQTDPVTGADVRLQGDDLQVQYVRITPIGELSEKCGLGDPMCSFNAYVTPLID